MICCYQLLYSLCWLLKHQLPSQEKSKHRTHAVSFAPDSVSISHAAREPVILTPWLCPRMSVTSILKAQPIFSSFSPSWQLPVQGLPPLPALLRLPTRAKLPRWLLSPHTSGPSSFLFLQPPAENHRPEDLKSVTHQVTPGAHMLVHVFAHNESFHLMRQFVLSTWPHFLYFIQEDIST